MSFALIIPTFNAGKQWESCLEAITAQSCKPSDILVIDSGSTDSTVDLAEKYGCRIEKISKWDFGHGKTRKYGVSQVREDIVVFLTQDAILANSQSLLTLLSYFNNEKMGACYGRQLPNPGASKFESFERLFNYPLESHISQFATRDTMGIKSVFLSNSYAAYRVSALDEVGGFPDFVNIAEDMYVAAKMLKNGWHIGYHADALVYHSHAYSLVELFQRYFDVGVFNSRQRWIMQEFGGAGGEARKFLRAEFKHLLESAPAMLPIWFLRSAMKTSGYTVGTLESWIPSSFKVHLSRQKNFWRD